MFDLRRVLFENGRRRFEFRRALLNFRRVMADKRLTRFFQVLKIAAGQIRQQPVSDHPLACRVFYIVCARVTIAFGQRVADLIRVNVLGSRRRLVHCQILPSNKFRDAGGRPWCVRHVTRLFSLASSGVQVNSSDYFYDVEMSQRRGGRYDSSQAVVLDG